MKRAARDERAQDPPEQHPVLQVLGHREEGERRQKDEQVVDGERLLDEIGLEELEAAIGPEVEIDAQVEEQRQRDPDERPDRRLARADDMRATVKDAQVERQHHGDHHAEHGPRQRLAGASSSEPWEGSRVRRTPMHPAKDLRRDPALGKAGR